MIEGMDVVLESPAEKLAMDNVIRSVDRSKITFLSNIKTVDEEKTVATVGGVSFGDTISQLSYDTKKSAWAGHIGSDVSTVEVKQPELDVDSSPTSPGLKKIEKEKEPNDIPMPLAGPNDKDDGMGGSGIQTINEEWTRHGSAEAETSLFAIAAKYGLQSLANTFSPTKGKGKVSGGGKSGVNEGSSGTQQP